MKMKSKLAELLLVSAVLGQGLDARIPERKTSDYTPNGNNRRTHKQNVKRRKLRRIKNTSRNINHAA